MSERETMRNHLHSASTSIAELPVDEVMNIFPGKKSPFKMTVCSFLALLKRYLKVLPAAVHSSLDSPNCLSYCQWDSSLLLVNGDSRKMDDITTLRTVAWQRSNWTDSLGIISQRDS